MDKYKLIKTIGIAGLIVAFFGVMIYVEANFDGTEESWEDNYYSVKFHKDYIVLKVPYNLEDGEQYDTIMVDKFLPLGDDNSYGFLRVNETTGKMEFRKWRHSNISVVKLPDNETINTSNIWINFRWNESVNKTTEFRWNESWVQYVYVDRGPIIFDDGRTILVDDYIFGLTLYPRNKIFTVVTLDAPPKSSSITIWKYWS